VRYVQAAIPNRWRVGPLARRLILLLALGAIIPMAISMTLSVMSFTSAQEHEILQRQVEVAKRTALTISHLLESPRDQLLLLSNAGDFSSPEGRQRAANDVLKANRGIESVVIVGTDGRELLHNDRYEVFDEDELRNVRDSAYFGVTQSGQTYIGPVTFSRFREPVVEMAVPLRDVRNNNVWGALAARFNLKVMWDVLAHTDVGNTGYAYVIDSKGRLIGHPDPSLVLGNFDPSETESVRHILGISGMRMQTHSATLDGLVGKEVLFSHSPIAETGWIAVVETPTSEAFAAARANVMRAIVVVALTLLGAGMFAVVMGRRFVKPIHELTESARHISAGDLSPLISVKGDDEVGQLAETFRLMVGKLKGAFSALENTVTELRSRETELKTLNESLEERVAERTRELSRANQELEVEAAERREAEEAIKETALFSELNPAPVFRFNRSGEIVFANPSTASGFGRSVMPGTPIASLFPEVLDIDMEKCISEGLLIKREARVGSRHFSFVFQGVPERGFGHAYGSDMTERKRAEVALEHKAQELVRSNAELGQFAYAASHDLQEPLRKIQAFSDLLTRKSGDALNDEGRDYLHRMKDAASRMQSLIVGLLDLSRVTTKSQPYARVDLHDLTQEVLSDLEIRIQESGGRVEVGDLPVIEADALQMRQLMQNLISNALKFRKPEEPPVVKVESRFINSANGSGDRRPAVGRLCELIVQDNGIGFDQKFADRIFGIFQRLHGRGAYEGTGIGLALCRKIAERHGGSIEAKSAPGEGATFLVTLSVKQPKEREA